MKREFKTMDANQAVANVAYRLNEAIAISRSLHALRWASGPTHGRWRGALATTARGRSGTPWNS
jgi:hypothetical protein